MKTRRLLIALLACLGLIAAACGDDSASEGADDEPEVTGAPDVTEPPADPTSTTTTDAPDPVWISHETPEECMCSDGSDFFIQSHIGDPTKVVLYFQGGGACFTEEMCDPEEGPYKKTSGPDDVSGDTGIFEFDNPDNPLADWSFIHVPYCTGDVHIGTRTAMYGDLTIEHMGFINASHGMDFLLENFSDAEQILVTGSSAGGVPSPLFGGLLADELPDADIAVLADGSGGYASNPAQNSFIGGLWGLPDIIPDWPELDGVPVENFGIPDMFAYAGLHAPGVRMARYDNSWDETQAFFARFAGLDGGLPTVLDANEAISEDVGVDLDVYLAPGYDHTILRSDRVYSTEVAGVTFLDWLTTFVEGGDPGDVRCTECGPTERPEEDDA
jgi:hypothetical protein